MQSDWEDALFVVQRYKFVLIFRTVVRRDSQLDLKHHDRTAEERLKAETRTISRVGRSPDSVRRHAVEESL